MKYKGNEKEYQRMWHKKNSERINKKAREKYNKNPQFTEKERERSRQYYQKTKKSRREIRINRKREFYKKYREYIDGYKLSKGCAVCGYNKCVSALDFHHNGDKKFNISRTMSIEKMKIEIEGCTLLCRNCHSELHERERLRSKG